MDNLQNFRRTDYCGTFSAANVGQEISVCGWVQRQRNLGGLIFVDLRDRTGLLQLSFDDSTPRDIFEKAASLRGEYVIAAKGLVRERESKNPDLPTGDIEVKVTELRLLAKAETPPFEIVENSDVKDVTRLKYRYLDLRRPDMQRMIALRHKIVKICRDYFDEQGFLEIETPILTKSTPASSMPCPSLPSSISSCSCSPALIATSRSPAASGTRTCGPTVSRSSPRSTWRCPSWTRSRSRPSRRAS